MYQFQTNEYTNNNEPYKTKQKTLLLHTKFATGGKDSPLFPLGVKLPPYFDRPHFEMAATILNKYKHILCYAASINTVGNALSIDVHAEMPSIRANGGFAGLSGPAVKYTALANVKQMRELLDDSIDVVGVGGVQSGRDAFELILCGAQAVQVGTHCWSLGRALSLHTLYSPCVPCILTQTLYSQSSFL